MTATTAPSTPAPLLDLPALGRYLDVAPSTLRGWRVAGLLPPALRIGGGSLRWRVADVDRWLESQREAMPTAGEQAGVNR